MARRPPKTRQTGDGGSGRQKTRVIWGDAFCEEETVSRLGSIVGLVRRTTNLSIISKYDTISSNITFVLCLNDYKNRRRKARVRSCKMLRNKCFWRSYQYLHGLCMCWWIDYHNLFLDCFFMDFGNDFFFFFAIGIGYSLCETRHRVASCASATGPTQQGAFM